MSIVFVDPPSPPGFVAFRDYHGGFGENCRTSRLKVPTLDLFHCASLLLEEGFDASVVDSVLENHSPDQCVDAVLTKRPSIVVFRTSSGSCGHDLLTARKLRARFAGRIAFYGPHASVEAETILAGPAVDAISLGEAPPLFLKMAREGGWSKVPGFWHKRAGRIVKNRAAGLMDLDLLPVPRWDLVDYRRYSYVTSQTSWGCSFRCGYCPYPVTQGARWRVRSTLSVVREFEGLRNRFGLKFVLLRDPEFALKRERTARLCRALAKAGTPLLWGCETRLDMLDEELVALMREAGCIRISFGVESLNESSLKRMGRRALSRHEIKAKVEMLKRSGLLTYALYMIGLPGETEESTRRLIDFSLELETNIATFSMATPFAGTALERLARDRGLIAAEDPARLTGCVPSMRNESMSKERIERLYLEAKRAWKDSRLTAAT